MKHEVRRMMIDGCELIMLPNQQNKQPDAVNVTFQLNNLRAQCPLDLIQKAIRDVKADEEIEMIDYKLGYYFVHRFIKNLFATYGEEEVIHIFNIIAGIGSENVKPLVNRR